MPREALNIPAIKELALEADDIWLKAMQLKNKVPVVLVPSRYVMPYELENSQATSLNSVNVWAGNNDKVIKKIFERYPDVYKNLVEEIK